MNRFLALAATCAAAVASIATSQVQPSWELSATSDDVSLTLATNGSVTQTISLTLNSAATASGFVSGRVIADASACIEGTSSGPVTLRLTVLNDDGNGTASATEVPACPGGGSFTANAQLSFDCMGICTDSASAIFERAGGSGGALQITWHATGYASGYGSDSAPEGAEVSIGIAP